MKRMMNSFAPVEPCASSRGRRPRVMIGVTHPQTCLTLTGRIRALRAAGYEVTLVSSPGGMLHQLASDEGAEAVEIPMRREIALFSDLRAFFLLWRLIRRLSPQLVEFSTPKAGLLGGLAAWICRTPVRIYFLRGLKLETSSGVKRAILLVAERLTAACAHVVLCNSGSLRALAERMRIASPNKLKLIGAGSSNGVDVMHFAPRPAMETRALLQLHGTPVIGFVGRLTKDKGVLELIHAFDGVRNFYPGARLLLVGWFDSSEDALSLEQRERMERRPEIHITGYVRDTAPFFGVMDVLALPSRREGFPNAVLEAAASGVPVVTTTSTGSVDSVLPGRTGLLAPPGDASALSSAILELLSDPMRRMQMGQEARAWVSQAFAKRMVLERTVSYYQWLLRQATEARRASGPTVKRVFVGESAEEMNLLCGGPREICTPAFANFTD